MDRLPKKFSRFLGNSSEYQYWIEGFARDQYLEDITARSFLNESLGMNHKPFQLEDYIPEEYMEVG
jgi:hypothetical protein